MVVTLLVNVNLNFLPVPNITSNFSDTTVCEDDTILVYGIGADNYLWNNNIQDSVPFISPIRWPVHRIGN